MNQQIYFLLKDSLLRALVHCILSLWSYEEENIL